MSNNRPKLKINQKKIIPCIPNIVMSIVNSIIDDSSIARWESEGGSVTLLKTTLDFYS